MRKLLSLIALMTVCIAHVHAQTENKTKFPTELIVTIQNDDSTALAKVLDKELLSSCDKGYSLLSHAIRNGAIKCFRLLIAKGADVNKICNGYIPPLMHAAKYGNLEMVKVLIAKGADTKFKFEKKIPDLENQTPLTYALKFNQTEVVRYLESLEN